VINLIEFLRKDNVLLALIPVLAFMGALLFESGYASAYGYGYEFIEIDLKIMVVSIICVSLSFFPFVAYLVIFLNLANYGTRQARFVAMKMILPIPLLVVSYIVGFSSKILALFLLVLAVGWVLNLGRVFWKSRKLGWNDALLDIANKSGTKQFVGPRPKEKPGTLRDEFTNYLSLSVTLLVVGLMISGVGNGVAYWKTEYQTFTLDGDEVAIVAVYGERIIVAGITEDQFNKRISIVGKDSGKVVNLRRAYLKNFITKSLYFY
jgi:hypothetical protein